MLRAAVRRNRRVTAELLHRCMTLSACACGKTPGRTKSREAPEIRGLERITYAERKHYVPGLAKPVFPDWEKDWHDPGRYRAPAAESMELYREQPCYIYSQTTNPLEILALAENPANQLEDQDERVQDAIRRSRFWDTNEPRPPKERYCPSLLHNLLHLCRGLQVSHPALSHRMLAHNYILSASWTRGGDRFQIRGKNGFLLNSMTSLPAVAGDEEIGSTSAHVLETFYPIAPTIDLQCTNVYQYRTHTGFREEYPYPHAHTLFVTEAGNAATLKPEQLRAKLLMFAFGNALARARALHGDESKVLEKPVVVQGVATNGRVFQFVVFQLNTTALDCDGGVKNLAWVDADQQLYDFAKVRPFIKKKVVKVPAGLAGFRPETFKKFLALFLHGATK